MTASVLINNHNYGRYLAYCIDSVLAQTYGDIEVIVYDDHSLDDSLDIVGQYRGYVTTIMGGYTEDYPSFKQANAINRAFEVSSGKYIFLLDSDDAFLPKKVETVVSEFERSSDVVLVQHPFEEIDHSDRRTGRIRPKLARVDASLAYIYSANTVVGLFSQTSGLAFRRSYLDKVLPIRKDAYEKVWPDVRLTRQAVFHGKISTLYNVLGQYRVHGENDSLKLKDRVYMRAVLQQMYAFFNEKAGENGYGPIGAGICGDPSETRLLSRVLKCLNMDKENGERVMRIGRRIRTFPSKERKIARIFGKK